LPADCQKVYNFKDAGSAASFFVFGGSIQNLQISSSRIVGLPVRNSKLLWQKKYMDDAFEAGNVDLEHPQVGSGDPLAGEPFNQLDPRFIQKEAVAGILTMAIVGTASILALVIYFFFRGNDWPFYAILGAGVLGIVLIAFAALVWPKLFFKHARWRLNDVSLEIQQGVFWKHRISVPLGRVQHADVSQGPLQRYFGLGTLIVHTAGTYQASVELDGLSHETAIAIRDQLIAQTQPLSSKGH
jgi:membrane protein YdbS with pleckstrin-like domain